MFPWWHSLPSPHGKTIENFSKVRQREPFHTAHTTASSSQQQTKNSSVALQHKALATTSITTPHQSQNQKLEKFFSDLTPPQNFVFALFFHAHYHSRNPTVTIFVPKVFYLFEENHTDQEASLTGNPYQKKTEHPICNHTQQRKNKLKKERNLKGGGYLFVLRWRIWNGVWNAEVNRDRERMVAISREWMKCYHGSWGRRHVSVCPAVLWSI